MQFNVTNVLYAYAYVALYYYGDYLSCAVDATNVFLIICENMRNNKVFEDMDSAIQSVIENINNVSNLHLLLINMYYIRIIIYVFFIFFNKFLE